MVKKFQVLSSRDRGPPRDWPDRQVADKGLSRWTERHGRLGFLLHRTAHATHSADAKSQHSTLSKYDPDGQMEAAGALLLAF
jgi:hypothetical protein